MTVGQSITLYFSPHYYDDDTCNATLRLNKHGHYATRQIEKRRCGSENAAKDSAGRTQPHIWQNVTTPRNFFHLKEFFTSLFSTFFSLKFITFCWFSYRIKQFFMKKFMVLRNFNENLLNMLYFLNKKANNFFFSYLSQLSIFCCLLFFLCVNFLKFNYFFL